MQETNQTRPPLDTSTIISKTVVNLATFFNAAYPDRIAAGSVRVFISELQEVISAAAIPFWGYTLKLYNFRSQCCEMMELADDSTRQFTCYWFDLDSLPPAPSVFKPLVDNLVKVAESNLPPARPVAVGRNDLIIAVRNLFSNRSGAVNEAQLFRFIVDVLGDQKPEVSPDPTPLIETLQNIQRGVTGSYAPAQIAANGLEAYKAGVSLDVFYGARKARMSIEQYLAAMSVDAHE